MHGIAAAEKIGALREGRAYFPGLVDVTTIPLSALAGLESSVLDATVAQVLPSCGGIGSRLWDQGGGSPGTAGSEA